ncbi:MAG: kelch repeat-containing protein [Dysgonomonas sp.]
MDQDNYIWIFGGRSQSNIYTNQVWKGRLNRLDPNN